MINNIKQFLLTVLLALVSISASAYSFKVDGIYYNITSSMNLTCEVTCVKYDSSYPAYSTSDYSGNVVIPESVEYNGHKYTITGIGSAAFVKRSSLVSVDLPASITTIGNFAFDGCSSLTSIDLPASLTTIGRCAFEDCSSLTAIDLPASITTIGSSAFSGCSSFMAIDLPASITTIEGSTFSKCSSLTAIDLPASITTIGGGAFSGCSSLTAIDLPPSITTIGDGAFSCCSSLMSIDLPASITTIGDHAFSGCKALTAINLPASITTIGRCAFEDCSSLTSINLPESITTIGDYAFKDCSSLTTIDLPASITTIGRYAFYGCSSLTAIDLPASITTIGLCAFSDCSSLTAIDLPASITTIGGGAFSGCSSLTAIELPKSVVEIGSNPFSHCEKSTDLRVAEDNQNYYFADGCLISKDGVLITGLNLSHITVPSSITTIGSYAFSGCSSLKSIDLPSSITTIGSYVFEDCSSLTAIELPESLTTIGWYVFCRCSSLTSIDLPSSITTIENGAFFGCSSLKTINLPSSITSIGSDAFRDCRITNATFGCLPVLAKKISYSYLNEITLMDNLTNFLSYEFGKCTNLKKLTSLALEPPTLVANQFSESQYKNLEVLVPDEALAKYKTANVWKDFANLKGINGTVAEKCATPTIAYADGELTFTCGTEGARFVYNVRENCTVNNATSTGKSTMRPVYTVTAYATADGYQNSDVATATFDLSDGYKEVEKEVIVYVYDSNEPTDIALETGETIKLYLSKGKATVVAAPFGTVISVYSNTGATIKTLTVGGIVTDIELPSDNIYIIKVGTKVFKVKV